MDLLSHSHHDDSKGKWGSLGRDGRFMKRFSKKQSTPPSAKLDILIESPPLVCYVSPRLSTGALLSCRLRVTVAEFVGEVTLSQFDVRLISKTTTKKPVSSHCPDCATRTHEVTRWNFITHALRLKSGEHDFPFSYLFPGHLPASCNGELGQLEYFFVAHAQNTAGEEFSLKLPLNVSRVAVPGDDKSSICIFAHTNLTSYTVMPSVVSPNGKFPVKVVLSGVVDKGEETQTRWRLRKAIWQIEECQKIVSTPCSKHEHKISRERKSILYQATRFLGMGYYEDESGWTNNFDVEGGEIHIQFDANINSTIKPICDVEAPGGLEVSHNLVIQLLISEEFCPNDNTLLITPTGKSRVLRMRFDLPVTEPSRRGMSWDEEILPIYVDVAANPPGYTRLDEGSSEGTN